MNDRERKTADRMLLEDAAKASGFHFHGHRFGERNGVVYENCYCSTTGDTDDWFVWRPLTDDGDALRLAVRLGLIVDTHGMHTRISLPFAFDALVHEPHGADPYAATRRAIVRAAAAMAGAA